MQPLLDAPWYDHASWFFGNSAEETPRHCGYSVGFALVGVYLERQGLAASTAVGLPAAMFFA